MNNTTPYRKEVYEEIDTWLKIKPNMGGSELYKELVSHFKNERVPRDAIYGVITRFKKFGTSAPRPNKKFTKKEKLGKMAKRWTGIQTEIPAPELSTAQIEQAVIDLLVKGRKYDEILRLYNE